MQQIKRHYLPSPQALPAEKHSKTCGMHANTEPDTGSSILMEPTRLSAPCGSDKHESRAQSSTRRPALFAIRQYPTPGQPLQQLTRQVRSQLEQNQM